MIPAVPTSRLMLLLTTIIAVLALMGTCWMPQVGAIPVFSPDVGDPIPRRICSTALSDFIQQMCQGRTASYRDLYREWWMPVSISIKPNSLIIFLYIDLSTANIFGRRRKRESHEIADRCCKTACQYRELLQFCEQ
ncbi:hypothetical protein KR032_004817 [Drosophila birchii]|nr:hypothetical protein KR032_004817 [Drosophila birchii]